MAFIALELGVGSFQHKSRSGVIELVFPVFPVDESEIPPVMFRMAIGASSVHAGMQSLTSPDALSYRRVTLQTLFVYCALPFPEDVAIRTIFDAFEMFMGCGEVTRRELPVTSPRQMPCKKTQKYKKS